MNRRASGLLLLLGSLALLSPFAAAQAPAPTGTAARPAPARVRGPIKISAERAELDRREYALYRGRVRLETGEMVLTGDRLELRQPGQGQFEARLTGAPARLDHRGTAQAPPVTASAAQIVYDTRTATVDLSGGVQMARGGDQLSSGQVRYNVAARRITANGSGDGRVHITLTPPAKAAPEKGGGKPQNMAPSPPKTPPR